MHVDGANARLWAYALLDSNHLSAAFEIFAGLLLAGASSWRTRLVLPEAMLFFVAGGHLRQARSGALDGDNRRVLAVLAYLGS